MTQTPEADTRPRRGMNPKIAVFSALVVLCAAFGTAYVLRARSNSPTAGDPTESTIPSGAVDLGAMMSEPHALFRNTEAGADFGKVEVVPLSDRTGPRAVAPLTCDRLDMEGSVGVCLSTNKGVLNTYKGQVFNKNFVVLHSFALPGLPSRVRLSPDGRYAAMTTFVYGDSYAQGNFSTRTQFVDTTNGDVIADLEGFKVTDGTNEVTAISRNYWGVTFAADSNRFYATLAVGAKIQMIEGDLQKREAHTLNDNVECPSLSPDQTRIAYKRRVGGGFSSVKWRIHVLNLETGADTALAETRNVDDQVAWLDNSTILYGLPRGATGSATDTYSVPADGGGAPALYVRGAWSLTAGAN